MRRISPHQWADPPPSMVRIWADRPPFDSTNLLPPGTRMARRLSRAHRRFADYHCHPHFRIARLGADHVSLALRSIILPSGLLISRKADQLPVVPLRAALENGAAGEGYRLRLHGNRSREQAGVVPEGVAVRQSAGYPASRRRGVGIGRHQRVSRRSVARAAAHAARRTTAQWIDGWKKCADNTGRGVTEWWLVRIPYLPASSVASIMTRYE